MGAPAAQLTHIAFTADAPAVSIPLPAGMIDDEDVGTGPSASFVDTDTQRRLTVRRWNTTSPHAPGIETIALLTAFADPAADDWDGTETTCTVDGVTAVQRAVRHHDGRLGTVVVVPAGDTAVAFRCTWLPDDTDGADALLAGVRAARLLAMSDLGVARTSLHHPLLGLSIGMPRGWEVAEADEELLELATTGARVRVARLGEPVDIDVAVAAAAHEALVEAGGDVAGGADVEPLELATMKPLTLGARRWSAGRRTGFVAIGGISRQVAVSALVDDPTRFDAALAVAASLRTHPPGVG